MMRKAIDTAGRQHDLDRFYAQIDRLNTILGGCRYLRDCDGTMAWPEQGVCFFFEPGEYRRDGIHLRVVRVEANAVSPGSKTTFWKRLRVHRGHRSRTGNHRNSIFRLLVGSALISLGDYPPTAAAMWGKGGSVGHRIRAREKEIEIDVSEHIGSMPFLWLAVDDEAGRAGLRKYIKQNSIALLSNASGCPDLPSPSWIGRACTSAHVRASGLWNSRKVYEDYDPAFLAVFEEAVDEMAVRENRAPALHAPDPPAHRSPSSVSR